jgi:hypothetical protein
MVGNFDSIFLDAIGEAGASDNSNNAANMISNVNISYNASDSTQRNAIFSAQRKISKAQQRKIQQDERKRKVGIKTGDNSTIEEVNSIFL